MLNCSISKEADIEIVYLEGELDALTSDELTKILSDFVSDGMHQIILDIGELSYISSNGLRPLLEWLDATKNVTRKRKLAVCNLKEFAREVFKITEFDQKFPIYNSVEIALKAFKIND